MPAKSMPAFVPKLKLTKIIKPSNTSKKKKALMCALINAQCVQLAQQMKVYQLPLEIKKTPLLISLFIKYPLIFLFFMKTDFSV